MTQTYPRFGGQTYEPELDGSRLAQQLGRVWRALADGGWLTPEQLEERTGDRWASISARLRDLRKEHFGAHTVERRRVEGGLFEYRLTPNEAAPPAPWRPAPRRPVQAGLL